MVYGLCRLLLRDADEAEDAAQQVFLSAYRSMLGGAEPQDPAAWLGAIARNECRSRLRARMDRPLAVVEERDASTLDLEHVAAQRAEVESLCAALAELPPQQRQAIVLREFYGLSYDEVRAALGLTDAAVESLIFRARKRLQTELRPARLASGALALPFALRDGIATAVPGFASASGSGGLLAKLGSLPLLAKLAASAATLTAAGTIGFAELQARDHDRGSSAGKPVTREVNHGARVSPARTTRAPVVFERALPGAGAHEGSDTEQGEERAEGEGGGNEGEGGGETAAVEQREETSGSGESGESAESGESGESGSDSGESGSGDGGGGDGD